MKPSIVIRILSVSVAFLSIFTAACSSEKYQETPADEEKKNALASLEASAPSSQVEAAYVFSDNVIQYNPCPNEPCPVLYSVGNALHTYLVDPVTRMPASAGIECVNPPARTQSIIAAPSGRFLYLLTADNKIQAYAIGYAFFSEIEFEKNKIDPMGLYNELRRDGYLDAVVASEAEIIVKLNELLQQPFFSIEVKVDYPDVVNTPEIENLKQKTRNILTLDFEQLSEIDQKTVIRLNRLLLELVYPAFTPANVGLQVQHPIGPPLVTPLLVHARSSATMEMEPLSRFIYVLNRNVGLAVYERNLATGSLTLTGTQALPIGQLVFAPSGLFAFGSTNGTLQSYRIDRANGLLTEMGDPFSFRGWVSPNFRMFSMPSPWYEPPFQNMAMDSSGKFLYLLASSGITKTLKDKECVVDNQRGTLVYTLVVDADSGRLTQAGPPLDTTPHIVSALAVDPFGRFVHLLNTHENYGPYTSPGSCSDAGTSPLREGAIYSYYVDQSSGMLHPSGSLQAGGTELLTGFVRAGADSVSMTVDSAGRYLYLLNARDMFVYHVDQATGALTTIGSPLTGATATAMPGVQEPVVWPDVCFSNGVFNNTCSLVGSRSHLFKWAGY